MSCGELYSQISMLPPELQQEVEDFVTFLRFKNTPKKNKNKEREFGWAKGLIQMSPDFDEPLEDFKDYM